MSDIGGHARARLAVGVMSGTSIDGLDAALVRLEGDGLDMRAMLVETTSMPLGDLAMRLRAIAEQQPVCAEEIASVAWQLGELHVTLIERLNSESPSHIIVHGQTVFHRPPISWQLINDAPIRARWPEAVVVSDLRQQDLALGGQGAPITPLADWVMFRDEARSRAIVNLGGFCNITILPASARGMTNQEHLRDIRGFDLCACNHILDAIARETMNTAFDEGGKRALSGSVNQHAADELFDILKQQRAMTRSLGTGDEAMAWVSASCEQGGAGPLCPAVLAASAVDAIARAIAFALDEHSVDQIVLAGGGALNDALARAVASHSKAETMGSDALGVPVRARESVAMAILGVLRADGVAITLPQVTGRSEPGSV